MSFEMRKLTSFPMQKLCYDLELEVLEQMEPEDAIELVKVNAGFRSILLRTPWIVFGRHVYGFSSGNKSIWIARRPHDYYLRLDVARHFPLFKRIHSCDVFWAEYSGPFRDEKAAILNQLKFVKHCNLSVDTNELLLKFLENFRSVVREYAFFDVSIDLLKENQVISERFKNFIANQMNDCQKSLLYCSSATAFHFYYDAFAKTSIKFLVIGGKLAADGFEKVLQSIVERGIPSKNLEAAIYMNRAGDSQERDCRIVDFLSRFPGMKRFDEENQQKVTKIATEIWDKHNTDCHFGFTEKSEIFRRNIDSKRDCVYMFGSYKYINSVVTEFFAFYVGPQSGKMGF